jgi:peptide/nickel transport system permease protein
MIARWRDSDLWFSFTRSWLTMAAGAISVGFCLAALFAPWVAPQHPFDPAAYTLLESLQPPLSRGLDGQLFLMGTDDQGRDVFSTIIYGARISLFVGFASVAFAVVVGITLGVISGYVCGIIDTVIMRIADVQLSFPAILIALLIDGVARIVLAHDTHDRTAILVLVLAIGLSKWVQYARTVRGCTLVERRREYVEAARVIGVSPVRIMVSHVLPNVMGPVLVIATIGLALAVLTEATLSFLGVGVPPTRPSLGTLIRIGNDYLFSGEWWITFFPGLALVMLVLSVNLLGDWLRDALNPKLR